MFARVFEELPQRQHLFVHVRAGERYRHEPRFGDDAGGAVAVLQQREIRIVSSGLELDQLAVRTHHLHAEHRAADAVRRGLKG